MEPVACASASDLAGHLYAALTLAERISFLRQADGSWVGPRTDMDRAAGAVARWKSQQPFTLGNHFEKRLHADGLTEDNLLAILGLSPELYSELFPTSPEWVRDLQRLYFSECSTVSDEQEFQQWARQGTNGFLWITYPLIQEGLRRFREAVRLLPAACAPFEPAAVEHLLLPNLLATLRPAVAKVMALELNIARVRGLLKGELPEERFRNFCDTLRQPEVRWSIVREYPVLFRSLHIGTMNWVDYSLELLGRLSKDWDLVRENLAPGMQTGVLTAISAGAGDNHRRGRSVAILEFSSGLKLVYKPHSLSLDLHFGEFIEWVNRNGFDPTFRLLKIIDRGCYGWSEFATHQPCSSPGQVERFYERLGGYLGVFYAFKAIDMHFENLIAAGEFPVPVDLETLFHPVLEDKEDPAIDAWQSSVLRVLLLPARILESESQDGIDISGLGAKSGQYYPVGRAASWERSGTDEMRLVRDKAVPMKVVGNRPKLGEQDVELEDFLEPFLAGFERAYHLMEARRAELQAPGGFLECFGQDQVRFIARPTGTYIMLLEKGSHPDMLRDAIDRDQLFDALWLSAANLPHLTRLIPAELKDLHGDDIPVFMARPNSCDLWTSWGERISEVFEQTAIEGVRQGLNQLGEKDLALQTSLIRAAIASADECVLDASMPRKLQLSDGRDAIDLARAVGDALCREAFEYDSYANWIGLTQVGSREISWCLRPLETDFYGGLPGCSFFLAYLGVLTGHQVYSRIARKSINLVRRQLKRQRAAGLPLRSLGGYSGAGGIIYTLAHLGVLWQDASFIDEANALAEDVPAFIETDRILDVVGGSAGCITALAVLNTVSPSDRLLSTAVLCGEQVLRLQQPQDAGVGWNTEIASTRPLTGFAHGAAGIAWALLKLASWSGDSRFRTAAESAIAYERSTFVMEEANWPDFRKWDVGSEENQSKKRFCAAWCHGGPGIALARIDSLPYMDDRESREEIQRGLRKTVESAFCGNHCLCHGDLGNLDILRYAAQKVDASWWSEIGNVLATQALVTIRERGCSCSTGKSVEAPGLMVGLAGIGYGLLRLACPERVPSVLVLAPPTQV